MAAATRKGLASPWPGGTGNQCRQAHTWLTVWRKLHGPESRGFNRPKHPSRQWVLAVTSGTRQWIRIRFHRSRKCCTRCRHSLGDAFLRAAGPLPSNRKFAWQGRIRIGQPGLHGWQRGHGRCLGRGRQHRYAVPIRCIGLDKPVPKPNSSASDGSLGSFPDREFDH